MSALPDIVHAPRTDAIYGCHGYLTKIPVAAIVPFLEALTSPGELVVDPFAGSGMTGVAALMCGRRAELSDLAVLGRHVARGYLSRARPEVLREAAALAVARAREAIGDLYLTRRAEDGAVAEMVRTVWSSTYRCPGCDEALLYFDLVDPDASAWGAQGARCQGCGHPFERRRWARGGDRPVRVVVRSLAGRLVEQAVQGVDRAAIRRAEGDPRHAEVPTLAIDAEREMYRRSALAKHGLTETRSFFSARNALALLELWRAIGSNDHEPMRRKLAFTFTAILGRASRRYQWGPRRPLNAQNQTYYVAPVHYEWNVFELFLRKVEAVLRADAAIFTGEPPASARARYTLASADELTHLADGSADYVFTDPPFGSNIFYSDMHLFHEAWLGEVTDPCREAVVRTSGRDGAAAMGRYEALLRGAFAEASRVLKPGRFLSVVFGNSKGSLWALLLRALDDAGFDTAPVHVAILDKGQRSVKGLASGSERVVTKDLVLTVRRKADAGRKLGGRRSPGISLAKLISAAAAGLDDDRARDPSALFVATLREAIRQGRAVDDLHLASVLSAIEASGYALDPRSGRFDRPVRLAHSTAR